jgi:hypothetical protein
MSKQEKWMLYAAQIQSALADVFNEDNDNFIDANSDDFDATQFFHALSNVVPTIMFNKLTGDNKNYLEFNHISNQLIFQFTDK